MIEDSSNTREYFMRDVPNNIIRSDIEFAFFEKNHPSKIIKCDIRDRKKKAGGGRYGFVVAEEKSTAPLEESLILEVKGKKILLEKQKLLRHKRNTRPKRKRNTRKQNQRLKE